MEHIDAGPGPGSCGRLHGLEPGGVAYGTRILAYGPGTHTHCPGGHADRPGIPDRIRNNKGLLVQP